jgi:NAD-dependent dihydropyrimidine dehydrogenase PreA subunit
VIGISERLNGSSYHPAYYKGEECTGCALCFYACPEPAAIRVVKP